MRYLKSLPVWLALLWLLYASVVVLSVVAGMDARERIASEEMARFERDAVVASVASGAFTGQLIHQVRALLCAVRQFHEKTGNLAETEHFIDRLSFDRTLIDNLYLVDADGRVVIAHDFEAFGLSVADRDYFISHRQHGKRTATPS